MLSKLCLTGFCNFARVTEVVLGSDIPSQIMFLASEGKMVEERADVAGILTRSNGISSIGKEIDGFLDVIDALR